MKKWLINSVIVALAWTYIIPVEAMFLSDTAKKRLERMRRTTRTSPSSTVSSLYEPEVTESGAGEVGEKSPKPVGTRGPIEQPGMLSQGWQTAQQTAFGAQQKASSLISSAAAGVQQGSAAIQRKLASIVDEVKTWSYRRVLLTLVGVASAIGVIIIIKNTGPNDFLNTIKQDKVLYALPIMAGFDMVVIPPLQGRADDIKILKDVNDIISAHAAGFPFKDQRQQIEQPIQAVYNTPYVRMKLPAKQKLLTLAEAALVKRMKDAMVAHAKLFPKDLRPQEVINFYEQHHLEDNGDLAHQAYDEAIDELGFPRAEV